jgi:hypothetical protein
VSGLLEETLVASTGKKVSKESQRIVVGTLGSLATRMSRGALPRSFLIFVPAEKKKNNKKKKTEKLVKLISSNGVRAAAPQQGFSRDLPARGALEGIFQLALQARAPCGLF